MWNNLPEEVKKAQTIDTFHNRCMKWLVNKTIFTYTINLVFTCIMNDSILVYILYIKCSKHSCSINLTFYKDTLSRLTLCPQGNCHAFSLSADFL